MRRLKLKQTVLAGIGMASVACGGAGTPASGRGKASPEELGRAVMEALSKRDKGGLLGLYATTEAIMSVCPEMAEKRDKLAMRMARTLEQASSGFETCLAFDWARAKPLSADGGESRGADTQCPGLVTLRDYSLEVDIAGQRVEVRLEDPIQLGSAIYLDDRIECRLATRAAPEAAAPAATPVAAVPPGEVAAKPPQAPPPPAHPAAPGVDLGPTCNQFVAAYEACVGLVAEPARPPLIEALAGMKQSWAGVTDAASRDAACLNSKQSMKAGLGALCPGLFD
jgi:hypothetical protein